MTHRMLLDTSSLTYRAFFALPSTITDGAGRPVNAVRGVLDMHAFLFATYRPDEIVHVFDADWRPAERVAAYDGYKSARPPDPDGLPEQFDLLAAVLDALGLPRVEAPGWEADDAIGALCAQAAPGDHVDIVTGDRDLLQLVRDGSAEEAAVRVVYTVKGVREVTLFDEAGVRAKYGVPPQRYVDFAILRGDPSDGLPGVKGVGEKTARDLVRRHGSIEELVAQRGKLTPALARRLAGAAGYLEAMRSVVPVRCDVALEWHRGQRDDAAADALAAERRIEAPLQRLREALDG